MQINLKTAAISAFAFCATAAFAANQARVDIPFGFTAKGQSYPAGSYQVALDPSRNFVTLSSKTDTAKHITWTVGPADAAQAPAVVSFDRVGDEYALKTIQMDKSVTPTLDKTSPRGISATTSIGGQ